LGRWQLGGILGCRRRGCRLLFPVMLFSLLLLLLLLLQLNSMVKDSLPLVITATTTVAAFGGTTITTTTTTTATYRYRHGLADSVEHLDFVVCCFFDAVVA
jgi:hypothetical protein